MVVLAALLGIAAGLVVGGATAWQANRRRQLRTLAERDCARVGEADARRIARIWAAELREVILSLQGQAEACTPCPVPHRQSGLEAALRQFVSLADDLQDQMVDATAPVLHPMPTLLEPLLRDAIAAVATSLAPGQRRWRLPSDIGGYALCVDQRALAQVLQRVLGNAARHSRPDDWIEIGLEAGDDFVLVVEDEGNGFCAPESPAPPGQHESRGIGLGLALARRLMEAHGGALILHAVARVGSRVELRFPRDRVIGQVAASMPARGEG